MIKIVILERLIKRCFAVPNTKISIFILLVSAGALVEGAFSLWVNLNLLKLFIAGFDEGSTAKIFIINGQKHKLKSFFSFLLANSPMARTKIIGLLKGILVFTLRIVQYIEIENNCPGVSNRGKLRFHHLKSNKDSAPYSCVLWILFYFQEILFPRCPPVFYVISALST